MCVDVDECADNNGGCQHQCTDTVGGYECSCKDGYSIDCDGHSCNGKYSSCATYKYNNWCHRFRGVCVR